MSPLGPPLKRPQVLLIEDERELDISWFDNAETIAITGATSTPQWLMQRVADAIYKMCGEPEKAELLPVIGNS